MWGSAKEGGVKDNYGPEQHDSERPSRLSAPVTTAIVGGVVAIITATLQFVVAPMVAKRNPVPAGTVVPPVAVTRQSVVSAGTGLNVLGTADNEVRTDPLALRLAQSLPMDPSIVEHIDRDVISAVASRPLSVDDIRQLNCWQLRVVRNGLPALHGHKFQDPALARIFSAQPWYRIGSESPLSTVEDRNMGIIRGVETGNSCLDGGA